MTKSSFPFALLGGSGSQSHKRAQCVRTVDGRKCRSPPRGSSLSHRHSEGVLVVLESDVHGFRSLDSLEVAYEILAPVAQDDVANSVEALRVLGENDRPSQ
jgi:hypothetical protein